MVLLNGWELIIRGYAESLLYPVCGISPSYTWTVKAFGIRLQRRNVMNSWITLSKLRGVRISLRFHSLFELGYLMYELHVTTR